MKTRAIKSILTNKFAEFVETITDPRVRTLVDRDSLITGGSIASMLLNEKVNDFDIYFTTKETALAVAQYYVTQFNTAKGTDIQVQADEGRIRIVLGASGVSRDLRMDDTAMEDAGAQEAVEGVPASKEYKAVFLSANAITLSDQVQIIIRFYGKPEEIHKNYDFIHCTNYWTSKDGELTLHKEAVIALLTKELRYVGSKYPLCSIIRTRKFIQRGWSINAGQFLKMAIQLNDLDLLDPKVLEDQLIGVDSAHFIALIESVTENNPDKIDASYLITMIDRIF